MAPLLKPIGPPLPRKGDPTYLRLIFHHRGDSRMYWNQTTMVKTAPVAGSAWARRLLISLTALALLAAPARAESVKVTHDKFVVQGKTIAVDRFEPTAKGKYPAVVLSHDSTGLKNLSFYRWCG